MGFNIRTLINLGLFGFAAISLSLAASIVGPTEKVSAKACGVNTGSVRSWGGLIVELYWTNPAGQRMPVNGGVTVNVKNGRGSANTGDVVNLSGGKVVQRVENMDFTPERNGCGTGNTSNVVLGYDATTRSTTGVRNWALDCGLSQHPGWFQTFTVSAQGTPSGVAAGGTWEPAKTITAINGGNQHIYLHYTPPKVSNWQATGDSGVAKQGSSNYSGMVSVQAGEAVTFRHQLKNTNTDNVYDMPWRVIGDNNIIKKSQFKS